MTAGGDILGVNFASFENWWRERAGIIDPNIPVLPEFMVLRIADKVKAQRAWNTMLQPPPATNQSVAEGKGEGGSAKQQQQQQPKRRSDAWSSLAEKLRVLVRMRGSWGDLHSIYQTRNESIYEDNPLPPWTRDPESTFSAIWDLTSVVMLVYVVLTVPLRVCFGIDIELWTVGFFIELLVDLFFVVDVVINFRTSFYDANGFRENRTDRIMSNYLRGWFAVDFFSCLPFGYVQYFVDGDQDASGGGGGQGQGNAFKGVKALRLMKVTKMIRLARLKRILARMGGDGGDLNLWQSIIITLLVITFLAHLLACFFYLVGESGEYLGNGEYVGGWVEEQEPWRMKLDGGEEVHPNITSPDERISLSTRYVASM
jgi:hypothetical protein